MWFTMLYISIDHFTLWSFLLIIGFFWHLIFYLVLVLVFVRVSNRHRFGLQQHAQRKRTRQNGFSTFYYFKGTLIACIVLYVLVIFIEIIAGLPEVAACVQNVCFYYLFRLLTLLQPFFVSVVCLKWWNKIKQCWKKWTRRNGAVMPCNATQLQYYTQ